MFQVLRIIIGGVVTRFVNLPLTPSNKKGEECQEVTQQFGKTLPQTLREEKQRTHVTHIHNSLLPSAALVAAAVFAIGVEDEFSADAFQKL